MTLKQIVANLHWLMRHAQHDRRTYLHWPLKEILVTLVTTFVPPLIPAYVVWLFLQQHLNLVSVAVLLMLAALLGLVMWWGKVFNQKNFWMNVKLRMRLSIADARAFLGIPYSDAIKHQIQVLRKNSANYGFEDDNSGADLLIPTTVHLLSQLIAYVFALMVMSSVSWLIPLTLLLYALLISWILSAATRKRNEIRKQRDQALTCLDYYRRLSYDQKAAIDLRLYHYNEVIGNKLQASLVAIEHNEAQLAQLNLGVAASTQLLDLLRMMIVYGLLITATLNHVIGIDAFTFFFSLILSSNLILTGMLDNYRTILSANSDLVKGRRFIDWAKQRQQALNEPGESTGVGNLNLAVEFSDVTFRYDNSKQPVLEHFNLKIKKGEHLALVGTNGAGKTTIGLLILRLLQPEAGTIWLFGKNANQLPFEERVQHLSGMFQENTLLATDITHNITVTQPSDPAKVQQIAAQTKLHEMILKLKDGYQTQLTRYLDDEGMFLSGGQTESLMFTRMLYKSGALYLLDEPTAALDALSERQIYDSFEKLIAQHTAIFVSHRLASVSTADRVCFLKDGKIIGLATHQKLLATNPAYQALFASQAKYYRSSTEGARS